MKQSYDIGVYNLQFLFDKNIIYVLARNKKEEWRGHLLNLTCTLELRKHTV